MQTLLSKLNSLPPYKVRLYARHPNQGYPRPMSNAEIALKAGLPPGVVRRISHLRSWNTVKVETMLRFCAACNVELLRQKRIGEFERRTNGFTTAYHLRRVDKHSHSKKFFMAIHGDARAWRAPRSVGPKPPNPRMKPESLERRAIVAGLAPNTVRRRIGLGWSEEQALTIPAKITGRPKIRDGQKQWMANNIAP